MTMKTITTPYARLMQRACDYHLKGIHVLTIDELYDLLTALTAYYRGLQIADEHAARLNELLSKVD